MEQKTLFHEDINDALRGLINACGGAKVVASKLWPEKTISDAQSYLNDCLNVARPAKLSPEQVLWLLKCAKAIGHHDAINYLCGECGYSNPQPIEPEDELGRMLREYLEISGRQEKLAPKIEEARLKLAR